MISAAEMHKTMYVAEVLSRTEDALEKLHHYYKFGRHSHVLLDELYSWFAHCGHLVFSLRLAGECDPWGGIEEDPHLASLIAELDFTPFYYLDYRRRIFYWNAYQEYLKAEPRWFRLWMRILERSEHSTASDVEDFSRWMLTHVSHEALTGGKVGKKDDVALMKLLRAGPGGRVIVSSIHVLEDMASALVSCVARADPRTHAAAQLQSLACILGQMRRIIVWDGAAEGHYTLRRNPRWGLPSMFATLRFWRAPGLLRITPKGEGGEVTCTYTWNRGSKARHQSWIRSTAAMCREYEDSLFETWSYDTGEYLRTPGDSAQPKACWVIADAEAKDLESICRPADAILEKLGTHPAYSPLVEDVAKILRAGEGTWGPRNLAWTHIRDLDQLVCKLECVCQQTQNVDGAHADEETVAEPQPVGQRTAQETQVPDASGRGSEDGETSDASIPHLTWPRQEPESVQRPFGEPSVEERPQGRESADRCSQANQSTSRHQRPHERPKRQKAGVQSHQNLAGESRTPDLEQTTVKAKQDSRKRTCRPTVAESTQDQAAGEPGSQRFDNETDHDGEDKTMQGEHASCDSPSLAGSPGSTTVPNSDGRSLRRRREEAGSAGNQAVRRTPPDETNALVKKLMEHHRRSRNGEAEDRPLSTRELQHELHWGPTKVQHAMTDLFGEKPFLRYREKCRNHDIGGFLLRPDGTNPRPSP